MSPRCSARSACCSTTRRRGWPDASTLVEWSGALVGARTANLLPGVWSARMPLKLRNRAVETLLTAWVEPWAAFAPAFGLADERPALEQAWRSLLCNQAHDSICGCSIDPVHERMVARYDDAEGLGVATVQRVLERLAGADVIRNTPWREDQSVAVFNASAEPRTDVVRVPLEGFPPWRVSVTRFDMHPLAMPSFRGVTVDGRPARLVASEDPTRVRFLPGLGGLDVEFVATDVPAFGFRQYSVQPAESRAGRCRRSAGDRRGRRPGRGGGRRIACRSRSGPGRITDCSASRTRSIAATPTTAIPIRCATSTCARSPCGARDTSRGSHGCTSCASSTTSAR